MTQLQTGAFKNTVSQRQDYHKGIYDRRGVIDGPNNSGRRPPVVPPVYFSTPLLSPCLQLSLVGHHIGGRSRQLNDDFCAVSSFLFFLLKRKCEK